MFPVAGDDVIIEGGFTVTLTANAACGTVSYTVATTGSTLALNGFQLDVSGAIPIPRTTSAAGNNVLAVGSGTLNGASVAFTNGGGGGFPRHQITLSTGTVTITGNVSSTGTGSASIIFSGAGLLRLGGSFYAAGTGTLTPSTGTVEFNGAGQTISAFTYNNLVFRSIS